MIQERRVGKEVAERLKELGWDQYTPVQYAGDYRVNLSLEDAAFVEVAGGNRLTYLPTLAEAYLFILRRFPSRFLGVDRTGTGKFRYLINKLPGDALYPTFSDALEKGLEFYLTDESLYN